VDAELGAGDHSCGKGGRNFGSVELVERSERSFGRNAEGRRNQRLVENRSGVSPVNQLVSQGTEKRSGRAGGSWEGVEGVIKLRGKKSSGAGEQDRVGRVQERKEGEK